MGIQENNYICALTFVFKVFVRLCFPLVFIFVINAVQCPMVIDSNSHKHYLTRIFLRMSLGFHSIILRQETCPLNVYPP